MGSQNAVPSLVPWYCPAVGRRQIRYAEIICALLLMLGAPRALKAQPAAGQTAAELFETGLGAMRTGDFRAGCPMVERSHQLDPTPGSLFTLAECLSRLGDFVNAIKRYGEFIQHYNALPPEAAVRYATRYAASQAAALKLRGEVGKISLRLPDNPPPATRVFVDGERVPRVQMDQPVLVNPGTHVVQTRVPGMRAMSHTLQVGAREHHTLQLRIRRPIEGTPPEPSPEELPATEARDLTWVYVTGGVAAAGLATGVVAGLLMFGEKDTIDGNCFPDEPRQDGAIRCNPGSGAEEAKDRAETLGAVAEVSLGMGLVSAAASAIIYFVGERRETDKSSISASFHGSPSSLGIGFQSRW